MGDALHGYARIATILHKRIGAMVALVPVRGFSAFLAEFVKTLDKPGDAPPLRSAAGSTAICLSRVKVYFRERKYLALVGWMRDHLPPRCTVTLAGAAPIAANLAALRLLNKLRAGFEAALQRLPLRQTQMDDFQESMQLLGQTFTGFGWQPTLWVHELVCHGGELVAHHHSLFHTSSIPTEARHRPWKRELRGVKLGTHL